MNPLWANLIGVLIVLLMLAFIGTWLWAWRPLHKQTFDALAQIPMQDPLDGTLTTGNAAPAQPRRGSAQDEDVTR